jgi:tetratricopeptide (TPR) repeat protein
MPQFLLRTLGTVSLVGSPPIGAVALDEPRLVALVVLLAVAGDAGLSDNELLLRITPDATAEHGRTELARLVAVTRLRMGSESAILRTGDGYAFAPGLVAMDVRVHAADMPQECADFLKGFKLPGSRELRDWLAATRWRVEPLGAPAVGGGDVVGTGTSVSRRSRRRLAAVGIVLLVVVVTGSYLAMARPAQGFAVGDRLLVANVMNETGDTVFDAGIASAATVALRQSRRLQLYPRSRLPVVYHLMQIGNPDTALTFELAQEVAQRDRVRFVLGLRIARKGEGYRVSGRLADVGVAGRVMETSADASTRKDVLAALDEVLLSIRRQLGETRSEVVDSARPLPFVTTASLEALRAYGAGSEAWSRGEFALARELWLRAVDIDTGFAMAYGALGAGYYYGHERAEGERYYGEALKRSARLSERERLQIQGALVGYRGNLDSAIALSRMLAVGYPGVATWYEHGTSLLQAHRDSEAMSAFRTGLRYDSTHVGSYINLATAARRRDRLDEALGYYARAGQIDSTVLYRNNLNIEWGGTLVMRGRVAEADSAFHRMASGPRIADRALGLRSLGYLALWRGHPDEAVDYFRQATDATVQLKSPLGEARNRMLVAAAYRAQGRPRDAAEEVTKTLALMQAPVMEPLALTMLATSCVRLGRVADAERVLALLRTRVNRANTADVASEAYVAGLVDLLRHRGDSALLHARQATLLSQKIQRWTLLAESFRMVGQIDSARVAVLRVLAEPGFGYEGQEDWLRAPLVLGDLLLAQRDTAGAVKAYRRLLDQWRDAPPELPDIVAVRTRLALLGGGPVERAR